MKYKDVDSYIASTEPVSHPILRELRDIILNTITDPNESISYNVPFYKFEGVHVGFAAFKNHATFGIGADVLSDERREELKKKGYQTGKETIQIKYTQEVPTEYLKLLLKEKKAKAKAKNI
ncbi:Uncharacterized conserved protein YdhG, YjbR/CyaY-like superfamily, DUF1801 family [Ekhidna lutea]|uniref:Uncharacterized conserved protein YdhG, YjbR/CyaY-like superfamily, DUF1801 family n=1 Tax=Ekhidna lutea TaxID=447679 RepID=A0A239LDJ3_EKHLU|nr:DUF1801 domain-containing protein [Ekhidna lutea]SNT28370.1 Uncharacterized conserved protein YdhG, YjbR/CyaY-like superfamily, DUF1801 family [Ekhidna lutea]